MPKCEKRNHNTVLIKYVRNKASTLELTVLHFLPIFVFTHKFPKECKHVRKVYFEVST